MILSKATFKRRILLLFVFSISLLTLNSQVISNSTNCEEITEQCLSELIREANFVFEGTVIKSDKTETEDGDYILSLTMRVDKIFKGDIKSTNVTQISKESELISYYFPDLSEVDLQQLKVGIYPKKVGVSGIFMGTKIEKISDKDITILTPFLIKMNLTYDLKFDIIKHNKKLSQSIFKSNSKKCNLDFPDFEDLYEFILLQPDTEYKDITFQNFSKETYEAWVLRKNTSEK